MPDWMKGQPGDNYVGWCNHNKHRGKLSVKMMKQHECLSKQCRFFRKNEEHPYWEQRKRLKELKKERKA